MYIPSARPQKVCDRICPAFLYESTHTHTYKWHNVGVVYRYVGRISIFILR